MPERNYLLGYGERLAVPIEVASGGAVKRPPYGFAEARERLSPKFQSVVREMDSLPEAVCPQDETVASLTLHPEYYAKSHFPAGFLRAAGLRAVGSRPRRIRPDKRSPDSRGRLREPEEALTTQLFVAGTRASFRRLADEAPAWTEGAPVSASLPAIEDFSAFSVEERVRSLPDDDAPQPLEIVLHASVGERDRHILVGYRIYLESLDLDPRLERTFFVGGLCFLSLRADARRAREVARFSFLRVLRVMPALRPFPSVLRSAAASPRSISLPSQGALDPSLRVAVFDGGLPENSPLKPWATAHDAPGVGPAMADGLRHGEQVTSALLFGSVSGGAAERPVCRVDHYRVLDPRDAGFDLLEVLGRIRTVIQQRNYEFLNLSIGPALPVEDDDIHAWTAVLDEHLSDGRTLATIAVGNSGGELEDPAMKLWRVQVPADSVNALCVGAADSDGPSWSRAAYSSRGPGRSPGFVKPDVLSFGGSDRAPFWVTDGSTRAISKAGTSYSAPAAMRAALSVRAHFGPALSPLAIKALLIHCAESDGQPPDEVGWGRIPKNLEDLVVCRPGCVRVVYQDEITAAGRRRLSIPIPREGLKGKVFITATFCFATSVDSGDPGNYTRAGLSVVFRPNSRRYHGDSTTPASAPFFRPNDLYGGLGMRRADAHKWETTLHRRVGKRADSLHAPVFDIHYNARAHGRGDSSAHPIRYALIITVEAKRVADLYDRVLREYGTRLQPLLPVIRIPVRPSADLLSSN